MNKAKQTEKGTAELILEAAEGIMAQIGYEALSMRAVGARVGISQAAIYRHYGDKAALVEAVVARGYARIVEELEGIKAIEGREAEAIAESMRRYVRVSLRRPELFKAVLLSSIGPAQAGTNVLAKGVSAGRKSLGLLVDALERGMASGSFVRADSELTAQALWAAMYGLTARIVLEALRPGKRRSALIERQIEIVIRGIMA